MMKTLLFLIVIFGALLSVTLGATFSGEVKTVKQYGKDVKYCPYKGLKLLRGSKIKNLETCERCFCTRRGLGCTSMGFYYKTNGDAKCQWVNVGCKGRWVKNSNTSRRCPKKLIPKEAIGIGK